MKISPEIASKPKASSNIWAKKIVNNCQTLIKEKLKKNSGPFF